MAEGADLDVLVILLVLEQNRQCFQSFVQSCPQEKRQSSLTQTGQPFH